MTAYQRLKFDVYYRCVSCRQRHASVFGAAVCCLLVETIWQCRNCKVELPNMKSAAEHSCNLKAAAAVAAKAAENNFEREGEYE